MSDSFFNMLKQNYNIEYTSQQKQAVIHRDGSLLLLSTPGSGKTTVLIGRAAHLILNYKIKPERILAVTFSRAAAKDMEERFNSLFGEVIKSKIHFSTIHSLAYNVVRNYSRISGTTYRIIEDDSSEINKTVLIKRCFSEFNREYVNDEKLEELTNQIGYIKNMMLGENEIEGLNINIPNFIPIYKKYEEIKKQNNYLDFDDMLTLAHKILKGSRELLDNYRNSFDYIMVDEGQDTSRIQHAIIRLIAYPKNNIFIVADDDQSIYGFRGSFPKALLNFDRLYPGGRAIYMERNFRSTGSIVTAANEFIKTNRQRYNKNMFTDNETGNPVSIVSLNNEEEQTAYVVEQIKNISGRGSDIKSTAVLYRNNISAIAVADALNREGIPFYLKEYKQNFFRHWIVQDIISFLKLSMDNKDIHSFERVYYKMNSYISKKAVEYLKAKFNFKLSVFRIIKGSPDLNKFQRDKLNILEDEFKNLCFLKPRAAVKYIESVLGYGDYLEKNSERLGYSLEALNSILGTLKLIASRTETIEDFIYRLDELRVIMDASKFNKRNALVTLSTVHSSKGLEFDRVYMIDLIDELFPTGNSIEMYKEGNSLYIEEERRLFYVGMTRARKELSLITINSRNGCKVVYSRFVGEVFSFLSPAEAAVSELN